MGYYTYYYLSAQRTDRNSDGKLVIKEMFDSIGNAIDKDIKDDLQLYGDYIDGWYTHDSCTWYTHERDIIDLSEKYPDILFTLHGEGGDWEDVWDKHFFGGRIQRDPAQIEVVYHGFDESLLECLKEPDVGADG